MEHYEGSQVHAGPPVFPCPAFAHTHTISGRAGGEYYRAAVPLSQLARPLINVDRKLFVIIPVIIVF
jgi:hypothetical protein